MAGEGAAKGERGRRGSGGGVGGKWWGGEERKRFVKLEEEKMEKHSEEEKNKDEEETSDEEYRRTVWILGSSASGHQATAESTDAPQSDDLTVTSVLKEEIHYVATVSRYPDDTLGKDGLLDDHCLRG
ncbi:hypothetical protein NQZ68_030731 [Dissostichus eleginoides]|nr:hypothetical protein NQZ68_030731 [Dissostichus eleginoides]